MKFFFFLFCTFGTALCLRAQKNDYSFDYGLLGGVSYSKLDFNNVLPPPTNPQNTIYRLYPRGGVYLSIRFSQRLSLSQEYVVSRLQSEIERSGQIYTLHYFTMPLYLQWRVYNHLLLQTGPETGILLNAKRKANGLTTDVTHDVEERTLGWVAGVAYKLLPELLFSARYQHGINAIGFGQRSAVQECKLRQFQFLLQYSLRR